MLFTLYLFADNLRYMLRGDKRQKVYTPFFQITGFKFAVM